MRFLSISGSLLARALTVGMFRHRTYTKANGEASRQPDEETP
ncbi:hypothetical protein X961_5014 [Burkholderia pseudomallei MSHR5613]|nr:hypothetical protein X961_5014 [Burkholderia pseudomallei MSHR5613]